MNEVLWPIVNINPQPELWYKPEKGKISLSETVEMQHKKIREMQKTIERLHHKLEQAQTKRCVHRVGCIAPREGRTP